MATSKLSIRIDLANGTRFGPGKAALLKTLAATGSISAAAKQLGMSYPRALKLIEQMNAAFKSPIVETQHGGRQGGGSVVTEAGHEIIARYERILNRAEASTHGDLKAIAEQLK